MNQTPTKQKRIEEFTLCELDMVYSLARIGNWQDSDIARVYRLSEFDVKRVFNDYVELRRALEIRPQNERLRQEPPMELTNKKVRKRRSDARYSTPAERQARYRARLKENRLAGLHHFPQSSDIDAASSPQYPDPLRLPRYS
jgi:hypothetical protein